VFTLEVLRNFVIALALGGLIGLQREHVKEEKGKPSFAGLRTFVLISLLGGVGAYLGALLNKNIFYIILAGYIIMSIVAYILESKAANHIGATTEIASVLTFLVGSLCVLNQVRVAIFIAVIITLFLALKKPLHEFAKNLKKEELYSTIKFAIIAFIILPFLPNSAYGPLDVLNPYIIWLMVVLISGISFAAYILIKIVGTKRGLGITGFLGGLISSTAVTTSLAAQSKQLKKVVNPFVFGILIASATMFIRVLIEVSVLNRALLGSLILPMGIMAIVGFASAIFIWFKKEKNSAVGQKLKFSSPFTLSPALKFGIFFGVILFVSKAGQVFLGTKGVYIVSFISGLADIDAITVSMANLARTGDIAPNIAVSAITIAACTNTAVKAGIAYWLGTKEVGWKVIAIFALILLCGLIAAFFV